MAKLLIIDDNVDTLAVLSMHLEAQGYSVAWASDAITAVSSARRVRPDVIVSDILLPAGSGFVVRERLAAIPELSLIPFIFMSAQDRSRMEARALELGAIAFMQKPFEVADLLGHIEHALAPEPEPAGRGTVGTAAQLAGHASWRQAFPLAARTAFGR